MNLRTKRLQLWVELSLATMYLVIMVIGFLLQSVVLKAFSLPGVLLGLHVYKLDLDLFEAELYDSVEGVER